MRTIVNWQFRIAINTCFFGKYLIVHVQQHLPHKPAPAVVCLRRRDTICVHADESKGGEHECKYQSYHLHGLLLSILQN